MSHKITFNCDHCNENFIVDEGMEMPPYWIGVQIALSNHHGNIPVQEQEVINHFCSTECFNAFLEGEDFKRRIALVDKEIRQ
jgi:hypothetical protein